MGWKVGGVRVWGIPAVDGTWLGLVSIGLRFNGRGGCAELQFCDCLRHNARGWYRFCCEAAAAAAAAEVNR